MTLLSTIITMRAPLGFGQYLTIEFDASKPVDLAPLLKMSGAGVSQSDALLRLKPLRESGAGAPLLHSATTSSQERRSTSPSGGVSWQKNQNEKSLFEDIQEARAVMAEKASELASVDSTLAPVRFEEQSIRSAIMASHTTRNGVVILNLGGAGERSPLFRRLDEISAKWGPLKNQRRNLYSEVKTLERHIEQTQRALERVNRKKART